MGLQSMEDASPPKWHLAHTTWFFEEFILKPSLPGYRPKRRALRRAVQFLLRAGRAPPHPLQARAAITPRHRRRDGLPTPHVEEALLDGLSHVRPSPSISETPERAWSRSAVTTKCSTRNCLSPTCCTPFPSIRLLPCLPGPDNPRPVHRGSATPAGPDYPGGLLSRSAMTATALPMIAKGPRHKVWLEPYKPGGPAGVTNGDWIAFMEDGGYDHAASLADGRLGGPGKTTAGMTPLYWWQTGRQPGGPIR